MSDHPAPIAVGAPAPTGIKRPAEHETSDAAPKRKRKSRWGAEEERSVLPGLSTTLPSNMTREKQEEYVFLVQVEELNRRLRTNDYGIPENPEERSPSPPPQYDGRGQRTNTREIRTRKKLEKERHDLIQKIIARNPAYCPPSDYKPVDDRLQERIEIPQEEYPHVNFIGLLIGPRGNTLKNVERETGAKVMIRGKGSVKEGRGRRDGMSTPGEDEPLHAVVQAPTAEAVRRGAKKLRAIIEMGKLCPEGHNELKRMQLRELAALNGTLRDEELLMRCDNCGATSHRTHACPERTNVTQMLVCSICGSGGHLARDCLQRTADAATGAPVDTARLDSEYSNFMQELHGGGGGGGAAEGAAAGGAEAGSATTGTGGAVAPAAQAAAAYAAQQQQQYQQYQQYQQAQQHHHHHQQQHQQQQQQQQQQQSHIAPPKGGAGFLKKGGNANAVPVATTGGLAPWQLRLQREGGTVWQPPGAAGATAPAAPAATTSAAPPPPAQQQQPWQQSQQYEQPQQQQWTAQQQQQYQQQYYQYYGQQPQSASSSDTAPPPPPPSSGSDYPPPPPQ